MPVCMCTVIVLLRLPSGTRSELAFYDGRLGQRDAHLTGASRRRGDLSVGPRSPEHIAVQHVWDPRRRHLEHQAHLARVSRWNGRRHDGHQERCAVCDPVLPHGREDHPARPYVLVPRIGHAEVEPEEMVSRVWDGIVGACIAVLRSHAGEDNLRGRSLGVGTLASKFSNCSFRGVCKPLERNAKSTVSQLPE